MILPAFAFADEPAKTGPERFAKDIAAFDIREAKAKSPEGAILFVGSSTIRLWDVKASWPGEKVINNGFGGSTLPDSIHFFERLVPPYKPRAIVVYAGDNDIGKGRSAEEVTADFNTLAGLAKESLPGVPLVYIAIKPSIKRWKLWPQMKAANEAIAAICEAEEDLYFADIVSPMLEAADTAPRAEWFKVDGLHLSPMGYERWTEVVNGVLREAGAVE